MAVSQFAKNPSPERFANDQLTNERLFYTIASAAIFSVANASITSRGLDVAVVRDRDAALHAVGDFLGVVFEAAQRSDFAFEHDDVVAQQANFGVVLDHAIGHAATGNRSHLRDAESFEHLGAALVSFFDRRFEQAGHGALDLVLQFVNDRVQADVDFFLLGQFLRLALRPHVEADDDGVRRRGQQHVGFGDRAHARIAAASAELCRSKVSSASR